MPPTADIDLSDARRLVGAALAEIRDLDGMTVDDGNTSRKAQFRRDILFTADLLDRAAAEVRATYHAANGYADPLKEVHDADANQRS